MPFGIEGYNSEEFEKFKRTKNEAANLPSEERQVLLRETVENLEYAAAEFGIAFQTAKTNFKNNISASTVGRELLLSVDALIRDCQEMVVNIEKNNGERFEKIKTIRDFLEDYVKKAETAAQAAQLKIQAGNAPEGVRELINFAQDSCGHFKARAAELKNSE